MTETQVQRADGRWLPVEVHQRAVRAGDGWVIVQTVRNISARVDAERASRRQALRHGLLARFGQLALENPQLDELMAEAVAVVTQGLAVELSRLLMATADDRVLTHVAGVGWRPGWVRNREFDAVAETEDRFALGSRESIKVDASG